MTMPGNRVPIAVLRLARRPLTVSWLTMMPRAASNSSTMRSLSGKRKYSHTHGPMISNGFVTATGVGLKKG